MRYNLPTFLQAIKHTTKNWLHNEMGEEIQ